MGTRRIRKCGLFSLLLASVVVAACGIPNGRSETTVTTSGPYDAAAEIRPDLIIVEPTQVQPGDLASIFFPDERTRGIHFVLESRHDDAWNLEYHLITDWGDGQPDNYAAETMETIGIPDIGIGGPGPDLVSMPTDVAPGEYRLCTGNSRPNICALLTVKPGARAVRRCSWIGSL